MPEGLHSSQHRSHRRILNSLATILLLLVVLAGSACTPLLTFSTHCLDQPFFMGFAARFRSLRPCRPPKSLTSARLTSSRTP